jgi:transglutaminase-like putative cysteine protease
VIDETYLRAGQWVESEDPLIVAFAREAAADAATPIDQARKIYSAVRDRIAYDPYDLLAQPDCCSARRALVRERGFCIPKAALLVACARVLGIQARIGFADVCNHLASPRLLEMNNGPVFRWHAYAELHLEGKWVKATPAFDIALCERCGIKPLEFDGRNDSVLHPYDQHERRHMEYVLDRGTFADVPFNSIVATWWEYSPRLFSDKFLSGARSFAEEVRPGFNL